MDFSLKKRQTGIIIAMALFLSMIFLDETGVGIILPKIQKEFHLLKFNINWVMNAFFISLSSLIILSGKISDFFGSRKIFITGLIISIIGSLISAFSLNINILLIGRVIQGIGSSLLIVTYTTIIIMHFEKNEYGRAMGTCASIASVFLAFGPLISGSLSDYISWRWVFGINVPLALCSLFLSLKKIIPDKINKTKDISFNFTSIVLFTCSFSFLLFALMQGEIYGWGSFLIIGLFIISALSFFAFILYEIKIEYPLIDMNLLKDRTFLVGNVILFCTQVCVMCIAFWAIWLQKALSLSPFFAGLALLPTGLPIFYMAKLGGILLDKYGPNLPIRLGCFILLVSIIWIAITAKTENYLYIFIGFLGYGIGIPFIISPTIATTLACVETHQLNSASAIINTIRQLGAAICFAFIGAIITNYYQINLQKLSPISQALIQESKIIYTEAFSFGNAAASVFALISFLLSFFIHKKEILLNNNINKQEIT